MAMLDVFNTDAFSVISLTDSINKLKFVPGRIGQLGIFQEQAVATTSIAVEEKSGILSLVSPSPRGAPGTGLDKAKRTARQFAIPHFELADAVMAEEVQNVRAWGSESETEMVMGKVAERMMVLGQSLAATQEYSRIGAIKGIVTYADSTTLNLFTEFGVSQDTEIDFDLDNASPASGALRKKIAAYVIRAIATNLDGVPFTGVHAFCGDAFFDDLIAHTEVRASYLAQQEASQLRGGYVAGGMSYGTFEFGGVTWENYRGSVGGQAYVHTDKCHLFPVGVPGLFKTVYAPADYVETVNTMGQAMYAKQYAMPNGKGVHMDVQKNNLEYCVRPKALLLGKRT